ncbi:hypothetical protein [Actinoplanes sp. GCM10030250]|uniref:hypothetical protein n=1 Tax=Actinoplanes sp. GCM10030250 TaxID=3273376 RepID=UPI003615F6C8
MGGVLVPGWMGWILVFAVLVAAAFGGAAVLAGRRVQETGRRPEDAARQPAATDPPAVEPEVQAAELAADADAVRAAAEHAAGAADEARDRAEQVAGLRDEAEMRYLQARWQARTAAVDETQRLVQRAALDAYRRGEITVAQLNGIWQHTGGDGEVEPPDDDVLVRAALDDYERVVAETADIRREAHVAEVAAEVLAEEVRIAEQDVLAAEQAVRAGSGLDGLLGRP